MQMLAAQLRLKPDTPKQKTRALLPYKPARYQHKNKIAVRNTTKTHKNNLITLLDPFNQSSFNYSIPSLCTYQKIMPHISTMQTTTKMNTILPCDTIHAFVFLHTIFITAIFTVKLGMSLQHQTCYWDIIHNVVKNILWLMMYSQANDQGEM